MTSSRNRTLSGDVVLVTGARGGIGRAICFALCGAGAHVVGTGTSDKPTGLEVDVWLKHDVTSSDDWARVTRDIRKQFGRLDCLINGAGIPMVERIADVSIEQWRRTLCVNAESVLLGLQASLPLLRESGGTRNGGASVVNVSSVAGLRGVAFHAAYSASKGAVTMLTRSAAKEFAALGYPIRVNSVNPGYVETRMIDSIIARYLELGLATSAEAQRTTFNSARPLGRIARPEEVAGGVVFLCSPAASFVTGSELLIDGGANS